MMQPAHPPAPDLDPLDRRLLDFAQAGIPILQRPWDGIAAELKTTPAQIVARIERLLQAKVIRQIAPIYDTRAMGYSSVLVAARVDEARINQAAAVVSAHPGVSHNYRREAPFNLWFTLATPPGQNLDTILAQLAQAAGFERYRALPVLRTYRIGVQLAMSEDEESPLPGAPGRGPGEGSSSANSNLKSEISHPPTLTDFDQRIIRLTQNNLPLAEQPFDPWCDALGLSFTDFRGWMQRMQQAGVLRRIAAILHHRRVGYTANGMGIWRIPPERGPQVIEQAGRLMAGFPQVTHCYERQVYEDWPYNLYTMIHARSQETCLQVVEAIARTLVPIAGQVEHQVLFSTVEYKKARLRYFEESPPPEKG